MEEQQNRQYINTKVHPVFEQILIDLLISKPDDVITFIQRWVKEKGHQFQDQHSAPHQTLDQLKSKYKQKNEDQLSSEEEEEDEHVQEMSLEQVKQEQLKKPVGGRISVSAEAFGKFNKKADFKPQVIKKSKEQTDKITKRIIQSFMFSSLQENDREIVINAMEERKYKQGDDGDVLYILEQGEADCYRSQTKNEQPKYLKTYKPGESFGELALLYNCPRAASIIANCDCVLFALDRNTFNNIVKDSASKKRDQYEKFLANVEILKEINPYERSQIADALKSIKCSAGEYVVRQGEEGDIFFMIEQGELEAWLDGQNQNDPPQKVKEYKPGMFFGELALISNQPRAASVKCKTDCTLVALDRYTFKRLLGPIDEILKRNAANYQKYNK